jgi:hypothetical protein
MTIEKKKGGAFSRVKIINFTGKEEFTCKGAPSSYHWAVCRAAKPDRKIIKMTQWNRQQETQNMK